MDQQDLIKRLETLEREGRHWRRTAVGLLVAAGVAGPLAVVAGSVGSLVTFQNGTVADASAMNANFSALGDAVNDNDMRLDEAESRKVSFLAKFNTGANLNPMQTRVPFDLEVFDDGDNFSTATGDFTVPSSGKYVFSWRVVFGNATASNNYRRVGIKVNGADYAEIVPTLGAFVNVNDNSYAHFSDTW